MNCKNFKIRQKNYKRIFYCSAGKRVISAELCSKNCKYYKDKYKNKKLNKPIPTKLKKSKKLAKLEINGFSLFSDNNKCYLCTATADLTWHEIYREKK